MAVIVYFEGRLVTEPQPSTEHSEAVTALAVSKRYRAHVPTASTTGTRYTLRASGPQAERLNCIPTGTEIVVIGHVETTKNTNADGSHRYDDVVVLDSVGVVPGPPLNPPLP